MGGAVRVGRSTGQDAIGDCARDRSLWSSFAAAEGGEREARRGGCRTKAKYSMVSKLASSKRAGPDATQRQTKIDGWFARTSSGQDGDTDASHRHDGGTDASHRHDGGTDAMAAMMAEINAFAAGADAALEGGVEAHAVEALVIDR